MKKYKIILKGGKEEIYWIKNNEDSIAGFQFGIDGINITGASGGTSEESGFQVSTSSSTVLGFTLTGTKDIKESTKNYGKTIVNMLKDRKLKMLSSKDKKTLLKIVKMMKRANESVFAVRQDKIKNGERYPEQPNINYDPEKGKSRIRKIRKWLS